MWINRLTQFLTHNWLILNVLIPLISACVIAICNNRTIARRIFISIAPLLLALGIFVPNMDTNYALGDWPAPVGIEYILDDLNFPFIIYAHIMLLLFSLNISWLRLDTEKSISKQYRHLLYAVLIAAHTGFIGILVTGDIFNLYVFIEISTLASYALISMGRNNQAVHGAFEYLVIGTIAATLILLGIGMLFSATGTLNMKHMMLLLEDNHGSRMVYMGVLLFTIGTLVKVALFPLHFWMIKAYSWTSGSILTYIASISGATGFYILLRFIYSIIGMEIFAQFGMNLILNSLGIIAILAGSLYAYRSYNLRQIVLFSATVQVGYICLMIANKAPALICVQYILADGMMKFVLFYFITQLEIGKRDITLLDLEGLSHRFPILCGLMTFNLISNMGLPITIGFFNKMNLLYALMNNMNQAAFIAVIISSIVGIEYNFRIIRKMYIGEKAMAMRLYLGNNRLGLIIATLLGFGLILL